MAIPAGAQAAIANDRDRNDLYAVGTGGVYRSADGGATWSQVLTMSNCSSIAVLPGSGSSLPSSIARRARPGRGVAIK